MTLAVSQAVHYRYMSYPVGIIKAIDTSQRKVLLSVEQPSCQFTKWVSELSVNPHLLPRALQRFKSTHPGTSANNHLVN